MRAATALALLGFAGIAQASPVLETRARVCPTTAGDAPYTVPCSTIQAAITCPNGKGKAVNGTILLVHGTGSTGAESWQNGPYNQLLPARIGIEVCWIDLPDRSLVDAEVSAEYVAYAISYLAATSRTRKIGVVGHSQGSGLNIQWALLYWPSKRKLVTDYIALAPDFHGTDEGVLLCNASQLTNGCNPSVVQQSTGSHYLAAQNKRGNTDLLVNNGIGGRTTALYTLTDDVIQPELVNPTSNLPGALVYSVQQLCGVQHVADHFTMLVDPAAYNVAVDALTHRGGGMPSRINLAAACVYLQDNVLESDYAALPAAVQGAFNDVVAIGTYPPRVKVEPRLQPYVCQHGDSTYC